MHPVHPKISELALKMVGCTRVHPYKLRVSRLDSISSQQVYQYHIYLSRIIPAVGVSCAKLQPDASGRWPVEVFEVKGNVGRTGLFYFLSEAAAFHVEVACGDVADHAHGLWRKTGNKE